MFNFIPLACSWRKMANSYIKLGFIRKILKLYFPQTIARTIATPTISGDQQIFCVRIGIPSHLAPPLIDPLFPKKCNYAVA